MARVATQLDVGRAPGGAQARGDTDVESRLAHRLVFEPVGNAVGVVAVETFGDEGVEAPGARFGLQARASAVQVGVIAFVEVERIQAAWRASTEWIESAALSTAILLISGAWPA